MTLDRTMMRTVVRQYASELHADTLSLSRFIYEHPETAFVEVQSSEHAARWLRNWGFEVKSGADRLATAFKARGFDGGHPCIGFILEYDALPDIGHACGHNLIAAMGAGAAVVTDRVIRQYGLSGAAVAVGTPAEENNGGGKILMLEGGWFDDLDCALILHPACETVVDSGSLVGTSLSMIFRGKKAHVTASPWCGANAIAAATHAAALVDAWRIQFREGTLVNSLLLQGEQDLNVLADLARLNFLIRTRDEDFLEELAGIVQICGECAATAMRCSVEITRGPTYLHIRNNSGMAWLMGENLAYLGIERQQTKEVPGFSATDMGNVTQRIPAMQANLKIREGIQAHSRDFLEACGGPEGEKLIETGIQAMAMTALDIIMSGEFVQDTIAEVRV